MVKKLSEKQLLFAQIYLKTGNLTQAYINAGYEPKGADRNGSRLLKHPSIQKYIQEIRECSEKQTILTIQQCQEALSEIISNKSFPPKDRINAIHLLMKSLGAFEPKKESLDEKTQVIIQKVIS